MTRSKAIALVVLLFMSVPAMALASWVRSGAAGSISSGSLDDVPTRVVAGRGSCLVATSVKVNVSWTPAVSPSVDSYEILRSSSPRGPYVAVGTVVGRTTASFSDATTLFSGTYYYVVRSRSLDQRSAHSNQSSVTTQSVLCT